MSKYFNKHARFAVIDLETTGMSPNQGDRITEVGIVLLENDRIVDRFESLVNPGCPIPPQAEAVTGITDNMVANAPSSEIVLVQAMRFVRDTPLVAHNASFDRGFLNNELREISRGNEANFLCTMLLSRRLLPGLESYGLQRLVSYLGIPKGQAHRALSDAEMTAHLLIILKNQFFEFCPNGAEFSADNLLGISNSQPKMFRALGLRHGIAASMKGISTYKPHKFRDSL